MKRAGKILLIFGAILGLCAIGTNIGAASIFGFLGLYVGVGFIGPAVTSMMSSGSADAAYNMQMASYGAIGLFVGVVMVISCVITIVGLFMQSIMALINVMALDDKKVGYILSIVFGVLGLVMIDLLIGFIIVLGGVLGLIGQIKENKKAKEQVLEVEK